MSILSLLVYLKSESFLSSAPRHLQACLHTMFQSDWIRNLSKSSVSPTSIPWQMAPLVWKSPLFTNCNPYPAKPLPPWSHFVFCLFFLWILTTPSLSSSPRAYICLSFIFLFPLFALILCHIRRRHLVSVSIIWGHFSGWEDAGLDYFGPIFDTNPSSTLVSIIFSV